MRILTLVFGSPAELLADYSEENGRGRLFARTRMEARLGEVLLVEVDLAGLPNRAVLRTAVVSLVPTEGMWLEIDPSDNSTRDFVLDVARGRRQGAPVERSHLRYPASLAVVWRSEGHSTGASGEASTVLDLSARGAFIRADKPPPVGSEVDMIVGLDDESIKAHGRVTWIGANEGVTGFGVELDIPSGEDGRRLRLLIRHGQETGKVDLG